MHPTVVASAQIPKNSYTYKSRKLAGLDSRYFIAAWPGNELHIVERERCRTRAIVKLDSGRWIIKIEGSGGLLYPLDETFPDSQSAILIFNQALFAWENPSKIVLSEYVRFQGKPETHRAAVASDLFYGREVSADVLADYPELSILKSDPKTYHADLFDRRENDISAAIADSKSRGNRHLDQVPYGVETMRGIHFHSLRDGSSGTVTTVGSDGLIRVRWDDEASAERNCADVDVDSVVTKRDSAELIVDGIRKVRLDKTRTRYIISSKKSS